MKFYCIADQVTVRGFRLAGVEGQAVAGAGEAVAALQRAVAQPDCAVVILTEKVAATIGPQLESLRFGQAGPLVLEIPGPEGPSPGHQSLRQFVQEAAGYRLT